MAILALILTRFYYTSSAVGVYQLRPLYTNAIWVTQLDYTWKEIRTWGKTLEWFGILYQFLFLGWKRRWRRFGRFLNMFLVGAAYKCIKNFLPLIPLVTIYTTSHWKWSFLWCSYQATTGPSGLELPRENSVFCAPLVMVEKHQTDKLYSNQLCKVFGQWLGRKICTQRICCFGTTSFQNNI